jgi:iron complex outermembrane receptor protein
MLFPRVAPLSLAVALAIAGTQAAAAALEEVIVTAQKKEESIQKAPISLVAFGAADIENKGINGLVDLHSEVPNLQLTPHPNSATTTRVFMRGVGNNDDQITQDPSVAVYLDNVYVARSQGLAMDVADIERVEVLRGPQGSLYGRNATGGAINFITRAPELGQFGFQQNVTLGNYDQFRSRTIISVPVGDTLAAQLSYLKDKKHGFVDNLGTGVSRFGDKDRSAYRVALHWQPIDTLDVRYSYDRSQIDDTPAYIASAANFDPHAKRPSEGAPFVENLRRNDVTPQGHSLSANWDFNDTLSFRSITGYRKLDNNINQNYMTGALGPFPLLVTATDSSQHQFSQEFQAVGDALDARLDYVAGLYYFDEKGDSVDGSNLSALGRGVAYRTVSIENSAYAVFGQGTYTPAILDDQLHVTLGLRYSKDQRKASLDTTTVANSGAVSVVAPGKGDKGFDDISPSLVVSYDINADVNSYFKAVKGYKTGGFNVRASSVARFNEGFDQENLWSYELGVKSQWFENRVRLNVAAFYENYTDIQVNVQSDPTRIQVTDVFNAGKATISGLEMDISARLTEGLTASLNYGYLDASYDKISDLDGNDVSSRYQFVEAPHNSATTSLEYEFPATPIGIVTAQADYSWQSEKFSSAADSRYVTDEYGLLNARLTLSEIPVGVGSFKVSAWGRNLEDKEYYAAFFNAGAPGAIFGDPRSYGVDFTYRY